VAIHHNNPDGLFISRRAYRLLSLLFEPLIPKVTIVSFLANLHDREQTRIDTPKHRRRRDGGRMNGTVVYTRNW